MSQPVSSALTGTLLEEGAGKRGFLSVRGQVLRRTDNNGQACNAAKRMVVIDALYDAFVERFTAKMLAKQATLVECGVLESLDDAARWVLNRVAAARMKVDPAGARLLGRSALWERLGQSLASLDALAAGQWPAYVPADPDLTQVADNGVPH